MKHSCRLNKFQLLNHVFIPKIFPKANTVWNCRGNKNMLEDNPTSQESPYTPKGVLQVIEAAWVEDNIWNVNKSVTLSSKLELCEADIMWLNIFSNLKAVYFGMKHGCGLRKFRPGALFRAHLILNPRSPSNLYAIGSSLKSSLNPRSSNKLSMIGSSFQSSLNPRSLMLLNVVLPYVDIVTQRISICKKLFSSKYTQKPRRETPFPNAVNSRSSKPPITRTLANSNLEAIFVQFTLRWFKVHQCVYPQLPLTRSNSR